MNWVPWLESAAVLGLAGVGVLIGLRFSRLPKPYWIIGYLIPLLVILIYGAAMRFHALALVPPISWIMGGRTKFAIIGLLTTMVLTTPLSRLQFQSIKVLVSILMTLATIKLSVWPFLAPAFNREQLAQLQTRVDANGICRQNTDFTCGPASAVTALRKLGLSADEGEIAILAHSSSVIGTPPDMLAHALQTRYGSKGLASEYRVFRSIDELKHPGFTLAVTKYRAWVDHYVAVLDVTNNQVVIGDPLLGLRKVARRDFEEIWRFEGVVLSRASPANGHSP